MKSEVISMVDLLFAHDPKYRSIKFRRQYDEIMGANSLWEKAENQYTFFGAKPHKSEKYWLFPSGAKTFYRHMYHDGDEESHRGKGYSAVIFDEINQFTWDQIKMLQTCLRSEADMDSFMIGTLNPDRNSWCMDFVEYYISPSTGFPDLDKCGEIRHYLIVDGKPVFGPDEEYFKENYYDLVYPITNLDTGERTYVRPKRFVFYFFNIFDNEIGMKLNPQYLSELNSLPEHERQTQLFGNWFAEPKNSSMFNRDMLKGLKPNEPTPIIPDDAISVRAWDKAYREPSEKYQYPDFTASIRLWKDSLHNLYITGDFDPSLHDPVKKGEDKIFGRFRKNIGVRNDWMLQQAEYDGRDTTVVIPKENGAGAGEFDQLRAMFKDHGFTVVGADAGNAKNGKAKRFAVFCAEAEQGMVYILPDTFGNKATLNAFLTELEKFNPDPDGKWKSTNKIKDDWVDALSDSTLILKKKRVIKAYTLPDCTSTTKYTSYKSSIK